MGMPYLSLFIRCLTKLAPLALACYGLFCGIMELRGGGWKGLPMGTGPMERGGLPGKTANGAKDRRQRNPSVFWEPIGYFKNPKNPIRIRMRIRMRK